MADDSKPSGSWWATLPGIITACGGLIGAATAMIVALNQAGLIGKQASKEAAQQQVAPAPSPQAGTAPAEAAHAPDPKQAALPASTSTTADGAPASGAPAAAEATPRPADTAESAVSKPTPANGPVAGRYLVRIVLKGDPATYFITAGYDIVSVAANAEPARVGQRTPPTLSGYVGHFHIGSNDYEVDRHGQIWQLTAAGELASEAAGHATRLKQASGD
ncbi:hypothetical protein ABWL39_19545 [Chitinivorax sp. PXF-14]|uniref:hypothetical protein n=1 Tax=Chitinivorax sp. PXF-14 TaxID=3230488 RepID=UPI003465C89B